MDFTITSTQILGFCALLTAIWGVWKIVKEIKKPNDDLKEKVTEHDMLLDNDDKRLASIKKKNKMTLQCLLVIINHEITGNGIEKMKAARDELQEYLINK